MDENKEALNNQAEEAAEQKAADILENTEQEAAEVLENTKPETTEVLENNELEPTEVLENTEQTADYADFEHLGAKTVDAPEEAPKKKFPLQKTLIIAFAIVAVTAIVAFVIFAFFNNGVTGEWRFNPYASENAASADEPQQSDENAVYYYFKFNNDGSATLSLGSTTRYGSYSTSKNDKGENILTLSLGNLAGDFYYEASGNLFTGRELKLTFAQDAQTVLNLKSAHQTPHEFKREGEFKPSEKLTGNWLHSDTMYGVTIGFNLKDDGTIVYTEDSSYSNPMSQEKVVSIYTIDGYYDYSDTTLTLHYYDTEDREVDIAYEYKDGVMIINGSEFTKDGAATADSAKK